MNLRSQEFRFVLFFSQTWEITGYLAGLHKLDGVPRISQNRLGPRCLVDSPEAKLVTPGPRRHRVGSKKKFNGETAWMHGLGSRFAMSAYPKKKVVLRKPSWMIPKDLNIWWFSLLFSFQNYFETDLHLLTTLDCSGWKGNLCVKCFNLNPSQKHFFLTIF